MGKCKKLGKSLQDRKERPSKPTRPYATLPHRFWGWSIDNKVWVLLAAFRHGEDADNFAASIVSAADIVWQSPSGVADVEDEEVVEDEEDEEEYEVEEDE